MQRSLLTAVPRLRAAGAMSPINLTERQHSTVIHAARFRRPTIPRAQRRYLTSNTHQPPPPPPRQTRYTFRYFLVTVAKVTLWTLVGTAIGTSIAVLPIVSQIARMVTNPPSDAETLTMYKPSNDAEREIEAYIQHHPLTLSLRADPALVESRPHLKIPDHLRHSNLTSGPLMGPGRVEVPPVMFGDSDGSRFYAIYYLGKDLCGHPGIVHGGLLATLLDEGLARCCFQALPEKFGVTANLNINYRKPTAAGQYVLLKAVTTKVEGKKAWVEGHIESLVAPDEEGMVLVEASALFVQPHIPGPTMKAFSKYLNAPKPEIQGAA